MQLYPVPDIYAPTKTVHECGFTSQNANSGIWVDMLGVIIQLYSEKWVKNNMQLRHVVGKVNHNIKKINTH